MTTEQQLATTLSIPVSIRQVPLCGYTINYLVAGSGPPLLLIHGANFGWGIWYPNIEVFAKHFTVYAIDLPGAGRSSRVDYARLDLERDLVQVVRSFITALHLQDITLIGCSVGGWLALRMAEEHPDRIKALILENTVGFAEYMLIGDKIIGQYHFATGITKTVLRVSRQNKNIEKFLRNIFYNKQMLIKPEFVDYFYETMATSHNLLFISRLTGLHERFVLKDQLAHITQPTLIVWGKEDTIMPLEKNQEHFSRIPRVQVSVMEGVGHIPSFEDSGRFNTLALSFLGVSA